MVSTCNAPDLSKPMANICNCREDDADNINLAGQYRVLLPHSVWTNREKFTGHIPGYREMESAGNMAITGEE
jgi:hypothetical protein